MRTAVEWRTADLQVRDVTVRFRVNGARVRGDRDSGWLKAVTDLSLTLPAGQSLGIVGESGCGKSTLARTIAGLGHTFTGDVRLGDTALTAKRGRVLSRRVQMVSQDPSSSLNPRMTVRAMLSEILQVHRIVPRAGTQERLEHLMAMVELPAGTLDQRPRSLSGGQRQRVGIARALAAEPDILILDEAIAALDVSVQASVLQLLRELQARLGISMIFISHDLGAVRGICDNVAVMYLGRIVEMGPVAAVLGEPHHPYTRALVAAEPNLDAPRIPGTSGLQGEPPSALNVPAGCSFRNRCPIAQSDCADAVPVLDLALPHSEACFHPDHDGVSPSPSPTEPGAV